MSSVPFAACIACINKLKAIDAPKLFKELGTKLTDGFREAGKANGFDLVVSGAPALFYLRIANDDSMMLHQEWIAECVNRGLFLASHHISSTLLSRTRISRNPSKSLRMRSTQSKRIILKYKRRNIPWH